VFKQFLIKMQQAFCGHRWAYVRADVIGGKRVAVNVCVTCRKVNYIAYKNEYDRDRLLTDMVFSAGRSLKN